MEKSSKAGVYIFPDVFFSSMRIAARRFPTLYGTVHSVGCFTNHQGISVKTAGPMVWCNNKVLVLLLRVCNDTVKTIKRVRTPNLGVKSGQVG